MKIPNSQPESSTDKTKASVIKVLRTLKKEGIIEFFVTGEAFGEETTESVFLMNKYGNFINTSTGYEAIYVKL